MEGGWDRYGGQMCGTCRRRRPRVVGASAGCLRESGARGIPTPSSFVAGHPSSSCFSRRLGDHCPAICFEFLLLRWDIRGCFDAGLGCSRETRTYCTSAPAAPAPSAVANDGCGTLQVAAHREDLVGGTVPGAHQRLIHRRRTRAGLCLWLCRFGLHLARLLLLGLCRLMLWYCDGVVGEDMKCFGHLAPKSKCVP